MTKKPVKVVHYNSCFLELTERWIHDQVAGLDKGSVKFYSVFRQNEDSFHFSRLRCLHEDLSYFLWRFNQKWEEHFHWYPQFFLWLREDNPDLIHAHFGMNGYQILPYAKWRNIPLITSFYGWDAYLLPQQNPEWRKRYKKLFKQGQLFLAEGPAMRKKLIELGCPPEKIIIHHIGVKVEDYKFYIRKPDNKIRLIVCGRFAEKKGIPYAIQALKHLRSRGKDRVCLTIVGDSDKKGTLTDEKKKILRYIEQLNLHSLVTLTGYVSHNELIEMIYSHHISIVPSIYASNGDAEGGFPVVLTEMLATGMPAFASAHCDIPEIIRDGESGFLVPERDSKELAWKIENFIEHPEIWPKIALAGRKTVEEKYDIKKLNFQLTDIYQHLVGTKDRKESKNLVL